MLVFDQYIYPERPDVDDDVVVFHSGFCSTVPNYSYGYDVRDYYLIHYVTGGKGTYRTGGVNHALKKNDGFLILPDIPIVHTADAEDPWDLCWVAFFGRKVDEMLANAGLDAEHLLFHYDQDDFLENCIKNIYDESRGRKNIAYITGQFYLFISRLVDLQNGALEGGNKDKSVFSRFSDAMNYINRHIYTPITVDELSSYMRLDTSQVYRIFKKHTGLSPQRYITQLRMEKACSLLDKTDLSIKDVSEWLHFEYQSHFTKIFKGTVGVTPSEYRRQEHSAE